MEEQKRDPDFWYIVACMVVVAILAGIFYLGMQGYLDPYHGLNLDR